MRERPSYLGGPRRGLAALAALTLAVAVAFTGGSTQASTDRGHSASKRCSRLFLVDGGYVHTGRVYNLTCTQAQRYSGRLPRGWSGASRNDGQAEHALIYRSRDGNRVMRAIRPGGATANPRILGKRPLIIIRVPSPR